MQKLDWDAHTLGRGHPIPCPKGTSADSVPCLRVLSVCAVAAFGGCDNQYVKNKKQEYVRGAKVSVGLCRGRLARNATCTVSCLEG